MHDRLVYTWKFLYVYTWKFLIFLVSILLQDWSWSHNDWEKCNPIMTENLTFIHWIGRLSHNYTNMASNMVFGWLVYKDLSHYRSDDEKDFKHWMNSHLHIFSFSFLFQQKASWACLSQDVDSCIESLRLVPVTRFTNCHSPVDAARHCCQGETFRNEEALNKLRVYNFLIYTIANNIISRNLKWGIL